ncbi:hypothetical protein HK102_009524 [Quaeritorhiza haematococci]|nr:hypothetical protein HK102_009524 [Quaeritorhiza haematococci]
MRELNGAAAGYMAKLIFEDERGLVRAGDRDPAEEQKRHFLSKITPNDALKTGEKQALEDVTVEIYEARVRDLQEKLNRSKEKCEMLAMENETLSKTQAKVSQDKQDIVDFLNIKVQEQEKHITAQENQMRQMDEEKREIEVKANILFMQLFALDMEAAINQAKSEIDSLQLVCAKYKTELSELSEFKGQKDELESQIRNLRSQLEAKERDYKENIHSLERKILQDKNQMKKEMLQKVNEAVANFRRVADQQMAETTKRAIRENMAVTSQLKKMSAKTIELIAENESLTAKLAKLKTINNIIGESERELAKKNQANQRLIKMLVEKLRESDKMLEIGYESGLFGINSDGDQSTPATEPEPERRFTPDTFSNDEGDDVR